MTWVQRCTHAHVTSCHACIRSSCVTSQPLMEWVGLWACTDGCVVAYSAPLLAGFSLCSGALQRGDAALPNHVVAGLDTQNLWAETLRAGLPAEAPDRLAAAARVRVPCGAARACAAEWRARRLCGV